MFCLPVFQAYINWVNFFVNLLTPVVTLVVLNVLIYRNMPRLGAPPPPPVPGPSMASAPPPPPPPPPPPSDSKRVQTQISVNNGVGNSSNRAADNVLTVV